MPELIAPTVGLHRAWLDAHADWGPVSHEDGFGLRSSDEVDSRCGTVATTTSGGPGMSATASGRPRLAVCAVDNVASTRTIERCGGVFEGIGDTRFGPLRRYWITPTPRI